MTVLFLVLPSVPQGHAQVLASPPAEVLVVVRPSVAYEFYGSGTSQVYGSVNSSMSPVNSSISFHIWVDNIQPYSANLTYVTNGSTISKSEVSVPASNVVRSYTLTLPSGTTFFQFSVLGSTPAFEFLWRYMASVPSISVTGLKIATSYVTRIIVPAGTILSQEYQASGPVEAMLPLSYAVYPSGENGYSSYGVQQGVNLVVLQSDSFLPVSVGVTIVALVIVVLAALSLFAKGRSILHFSSLSALRPDVRLGQLFQPRKLLVLFVLCALVMVSLAAVAGPDPRVKAYVIANPSSVNRIATSLSSVAGSVIAITPAQDYSDFAVMSSVGEFKMVVVSNYSNTELPEISGFVLPSLGNVPIIVYDNSANATFVNEIKDLYPSGLILHVRSASDLNETEQQELGTLLTLPAAVHLNALGLGISVDDFKAVLIIEGILSFVLVFVGWAYLGSLVSESGSMRDLAHLVTIIASGTFVFVFGEVIYVVTSSLLALPLSLHAVISGAHDITAVGLLGLGGGSDPRLAAGFLGVVVGALAVEGGLRVRASDAALVGGAVLFLLANPLSVGQYVFQLLIGFVPAPAALHGLGSAYENVLSFKGFLYGIGGFFGGNVSPPYLMSAGKIMCFAGLVPLAYLKKMGRITTVIALIAVAFMIGDGGIRVGEMTPTKTVIAIVPGIVAGFAFAGVLLALAFVEKYARGNWRSRG